MIGKNRLNDTKVPLVLIVESNPFLFHKPLGVYFLKISRFCTLWLKISTTKNSVFIRFSLCVKMIQNTKREFQIPPSPYSH
jgi:hypothetical protein